MYCLHCGNQLDDQVTFCPFCGQRVTPGPASDASAQPAAAQPTQGQGAQGAPYGDPAATAAYPGATAQYPAQAAYQQQAGQGAEGQGAAGASQQPADAAQQPADGSAPQGQGQKKGPSAVTIALAVVAVVAVLALALVVTGVVDLGGGDDATEDQTTEATADADDDTDATDDATTDDADASADATTDSSDATTDDATDTSDDASGSSSTSSGSVEAIAAGLYAFLGAEGFDNVGFYVSDDYASVNASMDGDSFSDSWDFYVTIEEDGTIGSVDIYVYWPVDGNVEEGFAHAEEVVAYVFDLLADGGYLDDWEDVPDVAFPDEFVAEAVAFAADATEDDSFYENVDTTEYSIWRWYNYDPDYYACMSYEVWR